jgi:hypothetical protein
MPNLNVTFDYRLHAYQGRWRTWEWPAILHFHPRSSSVIRARARARTSSGSRDSPEARQRATARLRLSASSVQQTQSARWRSSS